MFKYREREKKKEKKEEKKKKEKPRLHIFSAGNVNMDLTSSLNGHIFYTTYAPFSSLFDNNITEIFY